MLKDILPSFIYQSITLKNSEQEINEIRFRKDKPIVVLCNTKTYFLSNNGRGFLQNLSSGQEG